MSGAAEHVRYCPFCGVDEGGHFEVFGVIYKSPDGKRYIQQAVTCRESGLTFFVCDEIKPAAKAAPTLPHRPEDCPETMARIMKSAFGGEGEG
ncbi:MAG: hypothetical protein RX318_03790 [bacterium]|nr:hypothetical protein [bacterium]